MAAAPLKVLRIVTRLDLGGSAVDVMELCEHIDRTKFETHLLCGSVSQLTADDINNLKKSLSGFTIMETLKRDPSPIADFKALLKLYSFIKRGKFDIVHTHTSKAGFIGRLAARMAHAPVVIHTTHGHVFYGFFGKLKTKLFVILEKVGAAVSDRIFCLTELEIKDHLDLGIGRRELFAALPSGIDIETYAAPSVPREETRRRLGIPAGAPVIGTVARLDPIKGGKYLLEAFISIKDADSAPYLLFVGDGECRAELEARARDSEASGRVIFAGLRRDVPDLLHAMDIFVMPSLNEGYGKAIVEAMSAGVPVVATEVGGVPTLIESGTNGLLVPAADAAALAAALVKLISSTETARALSDAAKKKVDEKYSVGAMVRDVEAAYTSLYAQKTGK